MRLRYLGSFFLTFGLSLHAGAQPLVLDVSGGSLIDFGAVDPDTTTEGLILTQDPAGCTNATAEARICESPILNQLQYTAGAWRSSGVD